MDPDGVLIRVAVLSASIQDQDGAIDVFTVAQPVCPRLEQVWADAGYRGGLVEGVQQRCGWRLVIVSKRPDQGGVPVLPRRWVVERTFGWFGRHRRLSKDSEAYAESSESWTYLATIRLLLRRRVA